MNSRERLAVFLFLLSACHPGSNDGAPTPDGKGDALTGLDAASDAAASSSLPLEAMDVSFLFPLPKSDAELASLLPMDAMGAGGVIFARTLYSTFSQIVESPPFDEYSALRVTSARFDPCAESPLGPCRAEVRLVAQVVHKNTRGEIEAHDGAFHLFYAVSPAELSSLAAELRGLKGLAAPSTAFAPHGVLATEGLGGTYASALKALILRFTGDRQLFRVAEMTMAIGRVWSFAIFSRDAGGFARETIPGLGGAVLQQVFDDSTATTRKLRLAPAPLDPDLARLLDGAQWSMATDSEWRSSVAASLRIDNPLLTRVPDLDCASCHLATRSRRAALTVRPVDVTSFPETFTSASSKSPGDQGGDSPKAVMAFAYLGRAPQVTDRAFNDSVLAARRFTLVP